MLKKTVIEAPESEILALISDNYPQCLDSIVADQEIGNQELNICAVSTIDDYDQDRLNKWLETGKGLYMLQPIMNDLASKGIIEAGDYIIDCTW